MAHSTQNRGYLSTYTSFDIFKYTLATYSPLNKLWSRVIFYVKLDNEFAGRESELEHYIKQHFPSNLLSIYWFRNNSIEDFRKASEEVNRIDDDIIWFQGNHDHPFIDCDLETVESAVHHLKQDPDPMAAFWFSHWPEMLNYARNGQLTQDGLLIKSQFAEHVSIKVVKKAQWNWYWFQLKQSGLVFRFDNFGWPRPPAASAYVPVREVSRHFDGYSHARVSIELVPPLDIPLGFFQNDIKIAYGFQERQQGCVMVNPAVRPLTVNPNGTDYQLTLEELPLAWANKISKITVNDQTDSLQLDKIQQENRRRWAKAAAHDQVNNLPIEFFQKAINRK